MTDAIYYNLDNNGLSVLRFYSTGIVIGVGTNCKSLDSMPQILAWFNLETNGVGKGKYKFDGKNIVFELKSVTGTIVYNGYSTPENSLLLKIHSLINHYKSNQEYKCYNNTLISSNAFNLSPIIERACTPPIKRYNKKTENSSVGPPSFTRTRGIENLANHIFVYSFILIFFFSCVTCSTRTLHGCHCFDGSNSIATGKGACSHHGGVMYWKYKYWWDK